ncbi:hypothetical protein CAJAP_00942 [Camponotus japonicus]
MQSLGFFPSELQTNLPIYLLDPERICHETLLSFRNAEAEEPFLRNHEENHRLGSHGRFISRRAVCQSQSGAIQIRYWPRLCEELRMRVAIDRSRYEKTWRS